MKDCIVVHTASGERFELPAAGFATCAQAVYTSGLVPAPALCSGLGRCGQCAMRFVTAAPPACAEDEQVLDAADLEAGWRLGCRHAPAAGMELVLPPPPLRRTSGGAARKTSACLLAVDLGTTSLHWRVLDAADGEVLAGGEELNPQMGAGSEVMSRLAYASRPGQALTLRLLTLRRLQEIVQQAEAFGKVTQMCVAGNTVMTSLLLGAPLAGVSRAPYRLEYAGGEVVHPAQGLEEAGEFAALPPAYVPPQIAPFIGGDVAAGLAYLRFGPAGPAALPCLLADFGTNGEFVLWLEEGRALAASVALGPAIEGIGLTCGTVARPGAVTGFDLLPTGLAPRHLEPDGDAVQGGRAGDTGITGTGYLSLLHRLRSVGLLDEEGGFAAANTPGLSPLARRLAAGLSAETGGLELPLRQGRAWLLPADVEEILKVKAACNLAFSRLLREAGLEARELRAIHLAGALGRHVGVENLEGLGFLPPGSGARVRLLGNSSLEGAALLLDPENGEQRRRWTATLAAGTRVLDLAEDETFSEDFFKRMNFRYVSQ